MTRRISGRACMIWFACVVSAADGEASSAALPDGWAARSPAGVQVPTFGTVPGDDEPSRLNLVIAGGDSPGLHGWLEQTHAVTGGRYYQFSTWRRTDQVDAPRRSTPVRIKWTNDAGQMIPADIPRENSQDPGYDPLAEPEHPADGETDADGWTAVAGLYRAPSQATRAVLELHLQWAPHGRVVWKQTQFTEAEAPPPREVRLAAVHYTPSGKSPRHNCEEFAPLIASAGRHAADLVVLGETVPYVHVNQRPYETAEAIPGPTTEYFGSLAQEHKVHIVLSLYEDDSGVTYNTAVLLGPDGKLIGKYRKVCLPHSEIEGGVTPGSEYPVFDTSFGKVGLMVCYDGFFPEVARELANRGAEVIAWPVWGCNPLLARARACENHVFLVSSTYSQGRDWMTTAVFDRAGRPLVEAATPGQVVVTTVDLSRPHFWKNNLGDFRAMIPRHRP